MPRLLFIGSTVADVVVRIPFLPRTGQDLHVTDQHVSLGGCAYNAYHAAQLTGLCGCTLLSPEGTGVWGDWVRGALAQRGVVSEAPPVEEPNGCCYCMVEDATGERTFLSHHGAEYRFRREWVEAVRPCGYDAVYLCGLEVEEATGGEILDALAACPPRRLYFAPGPRVLRLDADKLARIHALHPVYHLNDDEALRFTGAASIPEAAQAIRAITGADVIVTLGPDGAYALTDDFAGTVPGYPAQVADTIGAGDAHVGTIMAARAAGWAMPDALRLANRMSAAVVENPGAELPQADFDAKVKGELLK